MHGSKEFQVSGKAALVVGAFLIIGVVVRLMTFADAVDAELEKDVRAVLWSTYSGRLGTEIEKIRAEDDYSRVPSLLKKAKPEVIKIERISRSEPLLSWASSQEVVVRVLYRFPGDAQTQTEYMKFNQSIIAGWVYQYDSSAAAYYLNFF